jgi:hypothetical protein
VLALLAFGTTRASGATTTSFAPALHYGVGSFPKGVAVGDVNGDGKHDLAVSNYFSNSVSILLGLGGGSFAPAVNYNAGANPQGVALGDVNGDGCLDLAVANFGSSNVSILLGNGYGSFAPAVNYLTQQFGVTFPASVAIGDVNGDGKPDLAVADGNSNPSGAGSVLLGNGNGTFNTPIYYGLDSFSYPLSVVLGDVNRDDKLDLAIANGGQTKASILLGNGNGTFATFVNYATAGQVYGVALGDVNGDGKLDLATANNTTHNVSILLGNGSGTFATAVNYGAGTQPSALALADVNEDGTLDIAVANHQSNNVSILLGTGTGAFAVPLNLNVGNGPDAVAFGDFNNDGLADLAVTNRGSNTVSVLLNTSVDLTSPYTNDPLTVATPVKALHITELQTAISTLRARLGLSIFPFTDSPLVPGTTPIRATAISELRTALDSVYDAIASPRPSYADPTITAGTTPIRRVHVREIRAAVRAQDWFVLTASRSGTGSGTITSTFPTGISCGTACLKNFAPGTLVTLVATPAANSTFTGWSGACTGTSFCQLTLAADAAVTATFAIQRFTLTVTKSGAGSGTVTSSPAGIDCGSDCEEVYDIGTSVTLSANAPAGSYFAGWGGACSGVGTCTISMNSNRAVTATFNRRFTLTTTKAGTGTGSVTSLPAGISCGTDCDETYNAGTSVTLTASAASGSYFANWTGACSGGGTCTVAMSADVAVGATFNISLPYTLTVTKAGPATGAVTSSPAGISCGADCSETYYTGNVVTLTASAPAGSYFANWTGACSGGGTCSVTMNADTVVGATFNTFSVDIDLTRGTVRMPNKYRTGNWARGGGFGLNWVAVPPGWSVGGGFGLNWVAVPPGWSVGGGFGVNWIAVPPGWSVGGGFGINWVAVPPGWSVADAYGLNFVVLPPGWSAGGGYGLNWFARPPGWSDGGGYGLNWFARPPGWSDGGGFGLNWVGLAPGWSAGGGFGLNWVPQPPTWTYGGGFGLNWVAHPAGWTVDGGFGLNWVAYPSSTTTTLELAFDDPGWLAWFQVLKTSGAMSDSDLADVMMYVLLGGWGQQGGAPSGQWP